MNQEEDKFQGDIIEILDDRRDELQTTDQVEWNIAAKGVSDAIMCKIPLTFCQKVRHFHMVFQPETVTTTPQIPKRERLKLRLSLILEELCELAEACHAEDDMIDLMKKKITDLSVYVGFEHPQSQDPEALKESLDALCDLQVVLSGTVEEFGMGNIFADAFDVVHESNMSKTCSSFDEACATKKYYETERNTPCIIANPEIGTWIVYRASDRKTLKSINYTPADAGLMKVLKITAL